MWDMAEKYLGDGKRWKEIAKLNKMKSGWDLRVGKDIKIPPKEKENTVTKLSKAVVVDPKKKGSCHESYVDKKWRRYYRRYADRGEI